MDEIELIKSRLSKARLQVNNTDNLEDRYILNIYIGELLHVIKDKSTIKMKLRRNHIFSNYKDYKDQLRIEKKHIDKFTNSYIKNKDYICDLLMDIREETEPSSNKLLDVIDNDYKIISKNDIVDILYSFLSSINLDDLLDKYIKENRIHEVIIKNNSLKGFNIYNHMNKENDIFIRKDDYTINTLFILIHELGHAYDFKYLTGNSDLYNKYLFESMYTESISKIFERLFLYYLINNKILEKDSINKLRELEIMNNDYINTSFLLSTLDDEYIKDEKYKEMEPSEIGNMIGEYVKEEDLFNYILTWGNIDLKDNLSYAIGDIISMYIKDEGLDSKLFIDFMKNRTNSFNRKFFDKNDINPDSYIEKYKKELQLIKK